MKAFMSDIQRPDSQPTRELCGCPNAAMREARRIQAIVEPDTPETWLASSTGFLMVRIVGVPERFHARNFVEASPMYAALADALRAFVEE